MRVKKVEYFKDYKLKILFSDGVSKIVDIEPIIKKSKSLFLPLKDISYFKQVSLDDDKFPLSIRWPNDADICPDLLYDMGVNVSTKKHTLTTRHKRTKTVRRKVNTKA